jgi:putative endonuclease
MANQKNGTIYIGVTGNLLKRVYEHKHNMIKSFTNQYNIHRLVYYEATGSIHSAIAREKQLKKWNRQWKIKLIEEMNPGWHDLYNVLMTDL